MKITIYDLISGQIKRTVTCPQQFIDIQVQQGEAFVYGEPEIGATHVIEGDFVRIEPEEEVIIPPTLDEVKGGKTKEIKVAFEVAFFLGYTTQGLTENFKVDCRRTDLDNVRGLLEHLEGYPSETPINFRDFDNQERVVTIADLTTIKKELIAYGLWLYQHKWEKEAEIEAAETIESVGQITW